MVSARGKRVRDIPDKISGSRHRLGISRGATVATARFAAGCGWYAAGLWRTHADREMWHVRTCDDRSTSFPDEVSAVAFFLSYAQDIADGRFEDATRPSLPSTVSRHGFGSESEAIQPPPSTLEPS
jgi:hypothetical protein